VSKTALVPADLYRLAVSSDARIAVDGSVFYVCTTLDEESDALQHTILRVAPEEQAQPFTAGKQDRMPRPSPDGKYLAFTREEDGGKRVHVMPLQGGPACAVTPAYDAIGALTWSEDAKRIAFTATAPHDPVSARIAYDVASGARHIRALPFKSDESGLLDGRRKHLFVLDIASSDVPRRITHGDFDVEGPSWSPDGRLVAFSARVGEIEHSFVSDIHVVDIGSGGVRKITVSNGLKVHPVFSHDGREIAFVGHEHGDIGSNRYNTELFVTVVEGGEVRSLSASVDRTVGNVIVGDLTTSCNVHEPVWSADDTEICVLLSSEGACSIVAFSRHGERNRIVVGGRRDINAFSLSSAGDAVFVYSDPITPWEVGLLTKAGVERRLTWSNPWLSERIIGAPRCLHPQAADGTVLDLFVLEPQLADRAPLVMQVHGGPHAAYGFTFMFEFQMLAGLGIGVAYGNPRGSQSYGYRIANGTRGNWGGTDASDVLAFLDAAEAAGSWDSTRIGIAGGSYGGFMVTWLLARSRRFAAGISMRAVNDFVSEVGASDCGWFLEEELALEWNSGRELFERSPMREAHRIEAPLLILHSERDYRCPIDQGEQLFTLLRRLGRKNVEFVRFIGDGHNLSRTGKPRNRILRLCAIAHWFIRYLRPDGVACVGENAGCLFEPIEV
jgi:dipeptidyl aminopeptidase/acylaminoacyl peptidase